MYILNIVRAINKMPINEVRDFIFENYYKRTEFSKENSYYSMKPFKKKDLLLLANKLIEKTRDPHNVKEHFNHYQSVIRSPLVESFLIVQHAHF